MFFADFYCHHQRAVKYFIENFIIKTYVVPLSKSTVPLSKLVEGRPKCMVLKLIAKNLEDA